MLPEFQKIIETLGWTIVGIILLYSSVWLFDRLDPINYREEIRRGNVAAGVIVAAIILSIGGIIITVLLAP
ncbi:MAG: DUF350 domain-containing protein [Synechococcales bacterium]|nr:DUF350 domain-containing protein [Synechococcales bacterium]